VLGWAWKPADPSTQVDVDLACNGQILGSFVADIFDNETIRGLVGPGVPGFFAKLAVRPPGPYPISLELRSRRGDLLGNPLVVNHPCELGFTSSTTDLSTFEGYIDNIADGYVTGWAWMPAYPNEQLSVELMEGGVRLDRKPASIYRDDLASAQKRNGSCGFRLELPISLLDDRFHILKVVIAHTQAELPGTSLSFGPLQHRRC
jgi:hypothetical protein